MQSHVVLYLLAFFSALVLSLILTPSARAASILLGVLDHPSSSVKTHKVPVPYFGGVAIFLSFSMTLLWIRVLTSFPTGTLTSLRGILVGGFFIFMVGLVDDIKHHGLHYRTKFFFQFLAALILILFEIQIKFVQPIWVGMILTVLWVVGVTNAFNLIDIMDGLASSVAVIAALAFLFTSLPTEEIYVNFAATTLAGAALGFLPYNLSGKTKIFMGDSGSLFLGFVASALALGSSYSGETQFSIVAPLIILAVPIFDTILVFILRIRRGMSPFLGSKDHFPLRLEILGWSRRTILLFCAFLSSFAAICAFLVTRLTNGWFAVPIAVVILGFLLLARYVTKVRVH